MSRAASPTERSLPMITSSTPLPAETASADALSQLIEATAGEVGRQAPLDVSEWHGEAHDPQRHPDSVPHALHLYAVTDQVRQHEELDAGLTVAGRHRRQVRQHHPHFAGTIDGAGRRPPQVVQVEQRVAIASRLKQVGNLRGDRALARPVDPCDQHAFRTARLHQESLGSPRPPAATFAANRPAEGRALEVARGLSTISSTISMEVRYD